MANTNTQLTSEEFKKLWEDADKRYYAVTPVGTAWGSTTVTPPTSGAAPPEYIKYIEGLQKSLGMKNLDPKTKTDAEWEEVARNNQGDAEVSALIRLLDIERAAVKALAALIKQLEPTVPIESIPENTKRDWTAFSIDPKAPLIPHE